MNADPALLPATQLTSQQFYEAVFSSLDVKAATITDYKYRIKQFHDFVMVNGVNLNLLLDYKRHLAGREDYSVSTKNKYLACATTFLRQCNQLGLIGGEIRCHVSFFTQSKKHKKFGISELEADKLFAWIDEHPEKLRENALLCLLLFQGLRQAEICNIRLKDVILSERTVFIQGKGQDDKEPVHLHGNTRRAVRRYMNSVDADLDDYLFSSLSRKSSQSKLTERGLRFIIKAILAELGIDKDVHGFRHYFATHLIRVMPGELTRVAQFTRHRSLEMLQVYNDSILDEESNAVFDDAFKSVGVVGAA